MGGGGVGALTNIAMVWMVFFRSLVLSVSIFGKLTDQVAAHLVLQSDSWLHTIMFQITLLYNVYH